MKGQGMTTRNQKIRRFLFGEQKSSDDRIRSVWNAIPSPLKCVPEPRGPWDNAKRQGSTYSPWRFVFLPIRTVVRAALATGNRDLVEKVARRVHDFFVALEAECLAGVENSDEATILRIAQEETRDQYQCDTTINEILDANQPGRVPDESLLERGIVTAEHQRMSLGRMQSKLRSMLQFRKPQLVAHR